ncbi:MAG TPA: hypothetical protein VM510_17840 [Caulifigura sp.]|nr:hypothetical protein [Caulifigura sp.]
MQPAPSEVPQSVPQADNQSLPKIPENPIRLEQNISPAAQPGSAAEPMPGTTAPSVTKRPVTPIGPVYYFAPNIIVENVTTPPAMHYPNSPWVEDLSVDGDHGRYVYYSYRRPWYTPGQLSANVTIVW